MHIRHTVRADIPDISAILCTAFYNNPLWNLRCPHRALYPSSFLAHALAITHVNYLKPGVYGLVVVSDASETELKAGTVLGFAWWQRCASNSEPSDPLMQNRNGVGFAVERWLRRMEGWYVKHICPNPVVDVRAVSMLQEMVLALRDTHEPIKGVVPHWHLSALAVDQKFQGRGVGHLLVDWGLENAKADVGASRERERLVVKLYSSTDGRRLYRKCGFRRVGTQDGPHVIDIPGSGGDCDWSMLWDPEGMWTRESEGLDENGEKWLVWTVDDGKRTGLAVDEKAKEEKLEVVAANMA